MKPLFPKIVCSALDFPVLPRVESKLRQHLTQVWPTRYLPMCPPACAALVDSEALALLSLTSWQAPKTLVVYLPAEFEAHLRMFIDQKPVVRIHPDVSLQHNGAYLSWSAPAAPGQLPLTLWVELFAVVESLRMNEELTNHYVLPVVFMAGESFVIPFLEPEAAVRQAYEAALSESRTPPQGVSDPERQKAQTQAEKYGERPWLFMRYEVKNADRRLAVSWAPVCAMSPGRAKDWKVD